jgi:hypothetical protein
LFCDSLEWTHFQWTSGQSPRAQFEVRFAELEEFKKNHGYVYFLGEDKKNFSKLASWKCYANILDIKVLDKEATNSVFTLLCNNNLIGSGLVPLSHYKYEEHADDDEDANEAAAAIGICGTGR